MKYETDVEDKKWESFLFKAHTMLDYQQKPSLPVTTVKPWFCLLEVWMNLITVSEALLLKPFSVTCVGNIASYN